MKRGPRVRGNPAFRFIDRWVGIPAMMLLGAFHRKRQLPADIRRIGLMKTVAIGDTLMQAGIVRDVQAAYPRATVVLINGPDNHAVGDLFDCPHEKVFVDPRRPVASIRVVRAAKLDVIVDFGPWVRFDSLLAATAGAKYSIGFHSRGQHRHYAFDASLPHRTDVHEVDNLRSLVRLLGVDADSEPSITAPHVLPAARMPAQPFVVFHCWAGGYMRHVKEWPQAHWVELGRRLNARGSTIVLSGGPTDRAKSVELAQALRAGGVATADVTGALTLAELADLFAASSCVVSVNTGVMHLAGQVGARTVSLEGPTSAARWRPRGPRVVPVETRYEGCGYLQLGWEYDGQRLDCMDGIGVDDVERAIERALAIT